MLDSININIDLRAVSSLYVLIHGAHCCPGVEYKRLAASLILRRESAAITVGSFCSLYLRSSFILSGGGKSRVHSIVRQASCLSPNSKSTARRGLMDDYPTHVASQ